MTEIMRMCLSKRDRGRNGKRVPLEIFKHQFSDSVLKEEKVVSNFSTDHTNAKQSNNYPNCCGDRAMWKLALVCTDGKEKKIEISKFIKLSVWVTLFTAVAQAKAAAIENLPKLKLPYISHKTVTRWINRNSNHLIERIIGP